MALSKINYIEDQTVIHANDLNNMQDAIIALERNTNRVIQRVPKTMTVAVDAGSTATVSVELTIPTGYSFLAYNGCTCGTSSWLLDAFLTISGNTMNIRIRNLGTSNFNGSITFYALVQRTSAL